MEEIRTHYLDTSAIVKLFIEEDGSSTIREYFQRHTVFCTTSICFAETLGVLKTKYVRNLLSLESYLATCEELLAHYRNDTMTIDDIGISERKTFDEAEFLVEKYGIDLADAFQLITLKKGLLSRLKGKSRPHLITADCCLAKAARSEGLSAWDCLREPTPGR